MYQPVFLWSGERVWKPSKIPNFYQLFFNFFLDPSGTRSIGCNLHRFYSTELLCRIRNSADLFINIKNIRNFSEGFDNSTEICKRRLAYSRQELKFWKKYSIFLKPIFKFSFWCFHVDSEPRFLLWKLWSELQQQIQRVLIFHNGHVFEIQCSLDHFFLLREK